MLSLCETTGLALTGTTVAAVTAAGSTMKGGDAAGKASAGDLRLPRALTAVMVVKECMVEFEW